jgi:hypothetical protein
VEYAVGAVRDAGRGDVAARGAVGDAVVAARCAVGAMKLHMALWGLGGGGKNSGRRRLLVRQGELADGEEGGEGSSATKQGADVVEALVEAADHIEDEGAVRDDLPEGAKVISQLLEATKILDDGEVLLDEVAEPRFKLDGTCFPVLEELGLDDETGSVLP